MLKHVVAVTVTVTVTIVVTLLAAGSLRLLVGRGRSDDFLMDLLELLLVLLVVLELLDVLVDLLVVTRIHHLAHHDFLRTTRPQTRLLRARVALLGEHVDRQTAERVLNVRDRRHSVLAHVHLQRSLLDERQERVNGVRRVLVHLRSHDSAKLVEGVTHNHQVLHMLAPIRPHQSIVQAEVAVRHEKERLSQHDTLRFLIVGNHFATKFGSNTCVLLSHSGIEDL